MDIGDVLDFTSVVAASLWRVTIDSETQKAKGVAFSLT